MARERGLARIAITDHNSIAGALEGRALAPDFVIVGEEIATEDGELIAYFLHEPIPKGLSLDETVKRIREQGGVVGASHPLDRLRREALGMEALLCVADSLDCLEVFNARVVLPSDNDRARAFAREHGLPGTGGSDAHAACEIGRAYAEVPPFEGPEEFVEALRRGSVHGRVTNPLIHFVSTFNKLRRRKA